MNICRVTLIISTVLTFAVLGSECAYCSSAAQDAFEYPSKGKRDPFVPLVGQEKAKVSTLADITSIEDVHLEGIAIGAGGKNIAILNGQMVKEKDKLGVIYVKEISQKLVQLSIEGKDYTLKIREPERVNKVGEQ